MLGEGVTFKSDLNKIRTKLGKDTRQGRWALNMEQSLYNGDFLVFLAVRESASVTETD